MEKESEKGKESEKEEEEDKEKVEEKEKEEEDIKNEEEKRERPPELSIAHLGAFGKWEELRCNGKLPERRSGMIIAVNDDKYILHTYSYFSFIFLDWLYMVEMTSEKERGVHSGV